MLEFPDDIIPNSMDVGLKSNTKVFTSTFNGSTLASQFVGDKVTVSMGFNSLDTGAMDTKDEAGKLSAFLFTLGGRANLVKIPMFHRLGKPPQGNPVVNTNGQTGGLLITNGWTPKHVVLKAGDYFTINDELKMVTQDAIADSSGNVTLEFQPWLRTSPSDGDSIVVDKPYGVFRMDEDSFSMAFEPMNGVVNLSFTESYYVS